jgi:diketogulonate reductase-like aldo/keto reductase
METTEYLSEEVDPVLLPIILALAKERPRGAAEVRAAICREALKLQQSGLSGDAQKLPRLLKLVLPADLSALALGVFDRYHQRRFGRRVIKALDLTHFVSSAGIIDEELQRELQQLLPNDCVRSIVAALAELHLHCLPKVGLGTQGLHAHMANQQPVAVAYHAGCRLFDICDPMTGFAEEDNDPASLARELAGKDISEVVLIGKPDSQGLRKPGDVRKSWIDKMLPCLKPMAMPGGGPLVDCYIMHFPFPGISPAFNLLDDPVSVSEAWAEMEQLVDEGHVRTLGVSDFTQSQIEALLKFCRIRPAVHCFEQHILNQCPEMVEFCHARKIACFAIMPLAQGDVLDSKHLHHQRLTPAQAALHWNCVQHVSVVPGAQKLEHIRENCALIPLLDEVVAPVNAPRPLKPLQKLITLLPHWAPYVMLDGSADDPGTFVQKGGEWYCATRDNSRRISIAAVTEKEGALIEEIALATKDLKWGMDPMTVREEINAGIGWSGATTKALEHSSQTGTLVHQFQQGDRSNGNLAPMTVVPFTALVDYGRIPRRSINTPKQEQLYVHVQDLKETDRVLFFSQRWLTPCPPPPETASPDDSKGTKYKQILKATKLWCQTMNVAESSCFIWLDFCSIEQDDVEQLNQGVNSLALYVCGCDAFITIDHETYAR